MVYQPTSTVSFAKTTLPYPIFAADFDPYNRGYLVVGGGGGESKTGVKNQITVLDVQNRKAISTAAEIELSNAEDSVQSLANLATKDGLITFAGINSSQASQNLGKNEHLRSFAVKYPPRKKQRTDEATDEKIDNAVNAIGQRSLFKPSKATKKETYQRLLRLSPARKRESNRRIGAVATGLAPDEENEIVVFNATNATPDSSDIITRIGLSEEAADMDIAEPDTSEFSLAYCTDYGIHEQTLKYDFDSKKVEKTPKGPRRIHQMPFPDAMETAKSRPKFRSVRFLNPQNVVALVNRPNKKGAELRIFHLYPTGPATLLLQKALPSRMKQASALDVCALDTDKSGNQQIVVAVAGQDISIEVYVTNYQRNSDTFSPFKQYLTLRDVHEHQMTKICFSPFHSPVRAPDPTPGAVGPNGEPLPEDPATKMHPGPQYIRLASVSYGNTVVVDTFPLSPLEPEKKHSRYVLSHPSDEAFYTFAYFGIVALIVLIGAFIIQSFIGGFSDEHAIGPFKYLPKGFRDFMDRPASAARGAERHVASVLESSVPTEVPFKGRLQALIKRHLHNDESGSDTPANRALVVSEDTKGQIAVDIHEDKELYMKGNVQAKHWHELNDEQKEIWKQRLIRAGEWVEGEGEKVLIGVLFSSYASLVGQAAQAAVA